MRHYGFHSRAKRRALPCARHGDKNAAQIDALPADGVNGLGKANAVNLPQYAKDKKERTLSAPLSAPSRARSVAIRL